MKLFFGTLSIYTFLIFFFLSHFILSEGKISQDEPAILPPLPIVPKPEKRRHAYGTPQSKRLDYRERDWDRDFELMPPPGSHKKDYMIPMDIDQPIDPNEPTYCVCHQVMIYTLLIMSYSFKSPCGQLCHIIFCFCLNWVSLLKFQVSFGDMIACDNENVSSLLLSCAGSVS